MEMEFGLWKNLQLHFVHDLANLILNCELSRLVCAFLAVTSYWK